MSEERTEFSTPAWLVAALAGCALAALAVAVRAGPAGRFFAVVLAAAAGGEALRSLLLRPTIAADAEGVVVATTFRRERFAWPEVASVTAMTPPSGGGRLRRRAAALELDLGERLVVVPGYRLGAPVGEVVDRLLMTPGGGSPGS